MTATAMVRLGGVDQATGTLVAVVGTEVRGMQDTPSLAPFGPYVGRPIFQITTYGNDSGETMSFQFVVGGGLALLAETLTFVVNANIGNALSPLMLSGELPVASPPQAAASPPPLAPSHPPNPTVLTACRTPLAAHLLPRPLRSRPTRRPSTNTSA